MPTRVHELTDAGIKAAKNYLGALRNGFAIPFPDTLLTDPQYAKPADPPAYVERRPFASRRDAGVYLTRRLAPLGAARVLGNARLWSWLGMFYFEDIVNKDINGDISLGRNPDIAYVIVPQGNERTFHNRLMLAYEIYTQQGENNAWYILDEPVNSISRFSLRLTNKQEVFRSKGIVRLAHLLYVNPTTRRLKTGALSDARATATPGSLPRLLDVLDQLYMTYDIYGMEADAILPLLPSEFDRFNPMLDPAAATG